MQAPSCFELIDSSYQQHRTVQSFVDFHVRDNQALYGRFLGENGQHDSHVTGMSELNSAYIAKGQICLEIEDSQPPVQKLPFNSHKNGL